MKEQLTTIDKIQHKVEPIGRLEGEVERDKERVFHIVN